MSQISHIAEVEDALIALLKTRLLDVKNIGTLSAEDFKDDDTIVADTPAIKLFFSGDQMSTDEITAVLYDSKQTFICAGRRICAARRKSAAELTSSSRRSATSWPARGLFCPATTRGRRCGWCR
jgi:hypothetical protein